MNYRCEPATTLERLQQRTTEESYAQALRTWYEDEIAAKAEQEAPSSSAADTILSPLGKMKLKTPQKRSRLHSEQHEVMCTQDGMQGNLSSKVAPMLMASKCPDHRG